MFRRIRERLTPRAGSPAWPRLCLSVAGLLACLQIASVASGATITISSMGDCGCFNVGSTRYCFPYYNGEVCSSSLPDKVKGYVEGSYAGYETGVELQDEHNGCYLFSFCAGGVDESPGHTYNVSVQCILGGSVVASNSSSWTPQ